ncbi:MAG: hypothetical protein JKX76_01570 [Colwellia sp.]|nr:hypothetical protein [Colwellia sp.]
MLKHKISTALVIRWANGIPNDDLVWFRNIIEKSFRNTGDTNKQIFQRVISNEKLKSKNWKSCIDDVSYVMARFMYEDYNQKYNITNLLAIPTDFYDKYIKFYAGGKPPYHYMSNFALITNGICYNNLWFPSTEHLFQSFKYLPEQRHRFTIDGDLGTVEGFSLVFGKDYKKKEMYWMKKNNIGIIAKIATNKKVSIALGLTRINFKSTDELWRMILMKKYSDPTRLASNGRSFQDILNDTRGCYLLEFGRGAKREHLKGIPPLWAGLISDDPTCGNISRGNDVLYGINQMGVYLMRIRDFSI